MFVYIIKLLLSVGVEMSFYMEFQWIIFARMTFFRLLAMFFVSLELTVHEKVKLKSVPTSSCLMSDFYSNLAILFEGIVRKWLAKKNFTFDKSLNPIGPSKRIQINSIILKFQLTSFMNSPIKTFHYFYTFYRPNVGQISTIKKSFNSFSFLLTRWFKKQNNFQHFHYYYFV